MLEIALRLARAFAPGLIGRLAGDNAERVAEQVLGIAYMATGATTPEEAEAALRENDAARHQFRMQASTLEVELERAYLEDRGDARARDVAMRNAGHGNTRADVLAYAIMALFAGEVFLLRFGSILEGTDRDMLMVMIGVTGTLLKDVVHFEFGSSRGSKDKDRIMERQADDLP